MKTLQQNVHNRSGGGDGCYDGGGSGCDGGGSCCGGGDGSGDCGVVGGGEGMVSLRKLWCLVDLQFPGHCMR